MTSLRFLGDWPIGYGMIAALLGAAVCYYFYRPETKRIGVAFGRSIPLLRSLAVGLIILMLTGPTIQSRWRDGVPGKLTFIVDDSASMKVTDGESKDRYSRAIAKLISEENGLLSKLKDGFEVQVVRTGSGDGVEMWSSDVRDSSPLPESASDWSPDVFASMTELGKTIGKQPLDSTLVIMTDGRVNQGPSLIEVAQQSQSSGRPIYTVGFGKSDVAKDLAIIGIEHADRLFRKDRLSGKVIIRDSIPAGSEFRIQASRKSEVFWEQILVSESSGQRSIAFDFPIDKLVSSIAGPDEDSSIAADGKSSSIPVDIDWQIIGVDGEADQSNNQSKSQFWASLHRSQVLLIDGRSRWETRYLKNVFERDPFWQIDVVLPEGDLTVGDSQSLPRGPKRGQFPDTRERLFDYDLVIMGEIAPSEALTDEEQQWIIDFVSQSAGGLIVIDGNRNHWSEAQWETLRELLPVDRMAADESSVLAELVQLTSAGRINRAMQIDSQVASQSNADLQLSWSRLPSMHTFVKATAKPSAEVLAIHTFEIDPSTSSATSSKQSEGVNALFATHMIGSGRVFYSATDETWRWRYKQADTLHQRFWSQVARWIMRTPFAVENEYVAIDTGAMNYRQGQEIELKTRLKNADLSPMVGSSVEMVIRADRVETPWIVALSDDANFPGVYRGSAFNLPSGNYSVSVRAAGMTEDILDLHSRFVIQETPSPEMNDIACDSETLRRVAQITGGNFVPEQQMDSLVDVLSPKSGGRFVQSEIALAESYWWFIPIVALLSVEWWLRKRVGLI